LIKLLPTVNERSGETDSNDFKHSSVWIGGTGRGMGQVDDVWDAISRKSETVVPPTNLQDEFSDDTFLVKSKRQRGSKTSAGLSERLLADESFREFDSFFSLVESSFIDIKEFAIFMIYRLCSMYISYIKEFASHQVIVKTLLTSVFYYESDRLNHVYAQLRRKSAKTLYYMSKMSPDVVKQHLNSMNPEIMEKWISDVDNILDATTREFAESVVTLYRS
jgi:hypothetical protein